MVPSARYAFNASFTEDRYKQFLHSITSRYSYVPPFRIAETPIFIPIDLKEKLFEACDQIADVLCRKDFKEITEGALNDSYRVPGEDDHSLFMVIDFGITRNEYGELFPQLIEIQGFPSLFFYQDMAAHKYRKYFDIPENSSHLFQGADSDHYLERVKNSILNGHNPKNVVLLEIEPEKQPTRIDFLAAREKLGIKIACVSDIKASGKTLYYIDGKGRKVHIHRIFNRVIFDELVRRNDLIREFNFTNEYEVEWAGHPNWFFRISKYTLPFLRNKYVPETHFLSRIKEIPDQLENYVLKPLFSFAGAGVVFNLNREILEKILGDPGNYILQKKVKYEPVIETPDDPVKCEVRMLVIWEPELERPEIINNLARLTKGEMVGVKYNKDKTWVGGSIGFYEK